MKVVSPRSVSRIDNPQRIVAHLRDLEFASLPSAVVEAAKLLILDTIAVAWAAQDSSGMPGALRAIALDGGAGHSILWGRNERVPVASAAFYNGSLASALDFDSLHGVGGIHADAVVIPAAFAAAERQKTNGKRFLAAYIAGAELAIRLGRASLSTTGWFRTTTYGVFGASVAAAKLFQLDPPRFAAALGIALGQASGTQQGHIERKLLKRIQAGLAARAGVFAAQLAEQGITGPDRPFDGEFGLFALFDEGDPSVAFDDFGAEWLLPATAAKKYPCCACSHAAIEAALRLAAAHSLNESEIESVEVCITPYMNRLVGHPFSTDGDPEVTAQFCVQYGVAAALARKRFSPADIEPRAVLDADLRPLLSRVGVTIDERSSERMTPATVKVLTRAGASFSNTIREMPGSADAPMSDEEIVDKARSCLTHGSRALTADAADVLIHRIQHLEELGDVNALWEHIVGSE